MLINASRGGLVDSRALTNGACVRCG